MGVKVKNNAFGTISAGISAADTTVVLDTGQGARFPTLGSGDYFYGTLVDTSNNIEIIKVTARSTDSMTVTRGQDNTTARAFAIGDRFELRPTAALFEDIINDTDLDGAVTINDSGAAVDFRVESDSNTHMLFVDGSDNAVFFGKSTQTIGDTGVSVVGGQITATASGDNTLRLNRTTSTGSTIQFRQAGSIIGTVDVTANGTTCNTTSDRRLKDNITPIADGTNKLMAMNPVSHTWKADPDAPAVHGFVAQEINEIVPEAVSKGSDENEMWSMDYGRITPVLVAALQDAHKKIEELEARINEMEDK